MEHIKYKLLTISIIIGGLMMSQIVAIARAYSFASCDFTSFSGQLTASLAPSQGFGVITNHTDNCHYDVGIATYKLYQAPNDLADPHKSSPDLQWLYTQQLFNGSTAIVGPNQSIRLTFQVPDCSYQIDAFQGPVIQHFTPGGEDYNQVGVSRGIPTNVSPFVISKGLCVAPTPTATPTLIPVASPIPTPLPTCSSATSGTYVNNRYCPTPTPTPTPESTGQVLSATPTPTPTPLTKLPTTGPAVAVVVPLMGMLSALLGKKYLTTQL